METKVRKSLLRGLKLALSLNTVGIEIGPLPADFKKEERCWQDEHLIWLDALIEDPATDPALRMVLKEARKNLSIRTWRGLSGAGGVIRGTFGGCGSNYRLVMSYKGNWRLEKIGILNFFLYTPVKPNFL